MPTEIRDTYGLPEKAPGAFRQYAAMIIVPAVIILLWLVLPHSAVFVALLALITLVAVFGGVAWVLKSGIWGDEPSRRPTQPPSTRGV